MTILLASASPTRAKLLRDAGLSVDVRPARIDEATIRLSLMQEGAAPRDVADALAEFKARKIAEREPGALVLGSDQVLAFQGDIFEKPASRDAAAEQLKTLRGATHTLLSAAVIYEEARPVWRQVGLARLTMHALTDAEIDSYLDIAWPDVAGSVGAYHAESLGARLFARIEGDWFSVLGLPLLDICSFLRTRGLM